MKIGELARRTACRVETIRFYEKKGMLPPPPRSTGNYRLYGKMHVERLLFIRRCRSLDMTLDEIRRLLQIRDTPQDDCSAVSAFLDGHIRQIGVRIAELQQLRNQLDSLRQLCSGAQTVAQCGILQELDSSGFASD
ncbi:Cd(II)/Pb(II)-responsive transcriptional regulator [Syntrophotalea acetylenivorans]|uniref:Cd(II)/Pb(II)-responsive transcriptional regulator n=1 Tax=Syntrophotalea acetylenivorans TaxID=1842532 RepID=A0A1L3GSW8_9BACT|nr:Cd(II)/Pb(II)-responsive transcriptional regulator [Syntrophotalea acetylenivorans]APG29021.1 Cd(II)/Pb(II)-responsive transcriptional regulator [Syntrophotalea acetylenivorans]